MAEVRKITIEITQNGEGGEKEKESKKDSDKLGLAKSVILNQAYEQAKASVIGTIERNIDHYVTLSEDYMAENSLNQIKTTINKVKGYGLSVVGGYVAGAVVNPIVGLITAGINLTGHAYSEVISYQSRMSNYYQSLNATKYQTEFDRSRAGLVNGSKGTEN